MIRIPITLSPHIVNNKPRGYYLLAERLFLEDMPILTRKQFIGFDTSLLVTFAWPCGWDSLFKMNHYAGQCGERVIKWISECRLYPFSMGFRTYIPSNILSPSAGTKKIETTGIIEQLVTGKEGGVYFVRIPLLSVEIMLGKRKLK